jgi:ankyrin repeat protein
MVVAIIVGHFVEKLTTRKIRVQDLHSKTQMNQQLPILCHAAHPAKSWANRPDNQGCTPLHFASGTRDTMLMLRVGADPNTQDNLGRTPLHYTRTLETAELMLAAGADASIKDCYGYTPPHYNATMLQYFYFQ